MENKYYEDEIDLYELWLAIKKRWKIIFGIFCSIIVLVAVLSCLITPVYKSTFLVKVPIITPDETKSLIEVINNFLKERNYEKLKNLLEINEDILQNLKKINCQETKTQSVIIEIQTTQKEKIPQISDALVNYLNKNEYVAKKLQIEREKLERQKNLLLSRLNEMKILKKIALKKIDKKDTDIVGFNPMEIERNIISTEIELYNTEKSLKLLKGFEKITEPFIPEKPFKPKKRLMVAISGITAFFFGVFLALFLEWIDKFRQKRS